MGNPTPDHSTDSDCTLDATDGCIYCGVYHGDPCPACDGRGFHNHPCPEIDDGTSISNHHARKENPNGSESL